MKKRMRKTALFLVMALVMSLVEPAAVSVKAENATGQLAGDEESGYYINMSVSGTTELEIPENVDTFYVYDNGGRDNGYSNGCSGYLLLTAPEGCVISLTGTVTTEGRDYDWLTAYDGNHTDCAYMGKTEKCGSSSGEELYLLSSTGNQVLLYFRSDSSTNGAGLDLTVRVRQAEIVYQISEKSVQGGTLECYSEGTAVSEACVNTEITVVGTPAAGYDLSGVQVTDIYGNEVIT